MTSITSEENPTSYFTQGLLLLVLIFCFSPKIFAESPRAYFKQVYNGVKVTQPDGQIKIAAKGDTLFPQDKVETLDRGFAQIALGQQGSIELDQHSLWKLEKLEEDENSKIDFESNLELGKLKAKVNALKKDSIFKVSTPTSVASVRGTEFEVSVFAMEDNIYTQVYVIDGIVIFTSLSGDMENQLGPGQSATNEAAKKNDAPQLSTALPKKNSPEQIFEARKAVATGTEKEKSGGLELNVTMAGEKEKNPPSPAAKANIVGKSIKYEN